MLLSHPPVNISRWILSFKLQQTLLDIKTHCSPKIALSDCSSAGVYGSLALGLGWDAGTRVPQRGDLCLMPYGFPYCAPFEE